MDVNSVTWNARLRVGEWIANRASGELTGPGGVFKLEPKVMDLLYLLAAQAGQPVPREQIMATLWPGVLVGEDSLARTVSKLRQALGDDAKSPRYIGTLSKRGYRLLADTERLSTAAVPPSPALVATLSRRPWRVWQLPALLLAAAVLLIIGGLAWSGRFSSSVPSPLSAAADDNSLLITRANDYYFQFSRGDNEAAIELYERVLGLHPDDANALAGLANALVQRSLRWPQATGKTAVEFTRLADALANGHLDREPARAQLQRARQLAERAVTVAPESAAAHKALGFVASAQRRLNPALASYSRAVQLDPDAWGSMINIGDVLEIMGRTDEALPHFEQAYAAMGRAYARNPVQVRPWYAPMGVLIAGRYRVRGDLVAAETWYRRVLAHSPLQPEATRGLAVVLRKGGDGAAADRLCKELSQRLGTGPDCEETHDHEQR